MSGVPDAHAIDWGALRRLAAAAAEQAYAPYSRLHVGAAALTDSGEVATGCNVENASYGLTLCAECALVGDLRKLGGPRLVALSVTTPEGELLLPCGRCRQILYEFGGPGLLIDTPEGLLPLEALLPQAFGPDDLPPSSG